MLLMIIITYKHAVTYKTLFIITADFKCSFIILINIVLLKIVIILKIFFINIKFIVLNSA